MTQFVTDLLLLLLLLYFMCMCLLIFMCTIYMQVPVEARRRCQSLWNGSYAVVSSLVWVPARAANALNHWAIPPCHRDQNQCIPKTQSLFWNPTTYKIHMSKSFYEVCKEKKQIKPLQILVTDTFLGKYADYVFVHDFNTTLMNIRRKIPYHSTAY